MIQEKNRIALKQNISSLGATKSTGNFNQLDSNTQIERSDVTHAK